MQIFKSEGILILVSHVSLWPFNNSGQIMSPTRQGIRRQEDRNMVARKNRTQKRKREEVMTERERDRLHYQEKERRNIFIKEKEKVKEGKISEVVFFSPQSPQAGGRGRT